MNKLKQNLGSYPNELRMKIDRTEIDVPNMSNQRMTSQWWETEGFNNEHRQKLGCYPNYQKLGWHWNEKAKEHKHKIRQNLGWHHSDVKLTMNEYIQIVGWRHIEQQPTE